VFRLGQTRIHSVALRCPRSRAQEARLVLRVQNSPTIAKLKAVFVVQTDTVARRVKLGEQFQVTSHVYNEPEEGHGIINWNHLTHTPGQANRAYLSINRITIR
jgi:hypothetical protein